ncbi:MAG TPA: hypothetical protein VMT29_16540 [Steroidobacteraceae bacterium]|nr:hypothetical protein [Steroidobacteraceae bacterium]
MSTVWNVETGAPLPTLGAGAVASAVSWRAIFAGALVAGSATLVLVLFGAGFGFAALSPWPHTGATVTAFAARTAIGLILVQWISAALGGYITGRLRTRWTSLHTHEVFFRDTAHGLIMWATATLIVTAASFGMATAAAEAATHTASALGGAAAVAAAASTGQSASEGYDIDVLLRPTTSQAAQSSPAGMDYARAQVMRILAQGFATGSIPEIDRVYLASLVGSHTGATPADAERRVDTLIAKAQQAGLRAREAADAARKAGVEASLFTAFSMLIGAFIASVSAALGGRLRDLHP